MKGKAPPLTHPEPAAGGDTPHKEKQAWKKNGMTGPIAQRNICMISRSYSGNFLPTPLTMCTARSAGQRSAAPRRICTTDTMMPEAEAGSAGIALRNLGSCFTGRKRPDPPLPSPDVAASSGSCCSHRSPKNVQTDYVCSGAHRPESCLLYTSPSPRDS